jgi:putative ABC transport system permease protein
MLLDHFRLAIRSLTRRKLRSWLTMLGIFIGIAAVVSLIGMGEGLRVAITSQFGFLGSDVLSVQASGLNYGPPGSGAAKPLTDDLAAKIKKVNGVEAAVNRYIKTGTLEFNKKQEIGFAMSMPEGENRKVVEEMMNIKAEQGRLLKDGDTRKVLLGNNFATKTTTFGKTIKSGDTVFLKGIKYQVVGIMAKKGSFINDNAVLVNEKTLLEDFGDDKTVSIISVKVKDEKQIDNIKTDIEKLLRKERNVKEGQEDFTVQSPKKAIESLNSTLFAVQLFLYIIASISLLVGGIGITNTMYTSVLERTKEIGIMKSIGAKNSTIFSLFAIESGLLGMVGGLIGVTLGIILAYGLSAIGRVALGVSLIQASISPWLIIGALAFSFILGTLAGVLPALRAAKQHPVDALRSVL